MKINVAILAILVISTSALPARASLGGKAEQRRDSRLISYLFDHDSKTAICAVIYDKNIEAPHLPKCEAENRNVVDAVKPDGVKLAFLSHLSATAVGCAAGLMTTSFLSHMLPLGLDQSLFQTILIGSKSGLIGGAAGATMSLRSAMADPTGHAFVGAFGAIVCSVGAQHVVSVSKAK
jgi:hypothetical protein